MPNFIKLVCIDYTTKASLQLSLQPSQQPSSQQAATHFLSIAEPNWYERYTNKSYAQKGLKQHTN
jgi:hypothetical protein